MKLSWRGIFPAVTTQFKPDFSLDMDGIERVIKRLVEDGVSGMVVCGTVGEGNALTADEKRVVMEIAVGAVGGKIPVLVGVSEYTTALAVKLATEAQTTGVDGLMVLPAMAYAAKPGEIVTHFKTIAGTTDLPVMIYNNPSAYGNDVTPEMAAELAKIDTVVAIKESSGQTARFVDLKNTVSDDLLLFCGLDDVLVESVTLGAVGWVSGMSNVFPREAKQLFELAKAGRMDDALTLYRWFMPLLHLDARPDLVQCIKLCEQIAGRGSELTRPPRLPLTGDERAEIEALMATALDSKPLIQDL